MQPIESDAVACEAYGIADTWRQQLDSVFKKIAPFENMDSTELARLTLGNLDVDFPERKEWETSSSSKRK